MTHGTADLRRILFVGIAVSLAGLALFVFFAVQYLNDGPVTRFDWQCMQVFYYHSKGHESLLVFLRLVTHVGGVSTMGGVAILGALVLLMRREYVLAAGWVLAAGGGGLANYTIKEWIGRDRPPKEWRDEAVKETNKSYPSGHSMGSTIGWGSLAYVLVLKLRRRDARALVIVGLTLLVLLIGFSRMYLRAHWVSDVLGGFGFGTFWLGLCVTGTEVARRRLPLAA